MASGYLGDMNYKLIREILAEKISKEESNAVKEEILNYLSRQFADAVWVMDNEMIFRYVSDDVLGFNAEDFKGKRLIEFLPEDESVAIKELHQRRRNYSDEEQKKFLHRVMELKMRDVEGKFVDIEIFSVPLKDKEGKVVGVAGGYRKLEDIQVENVRIRKELNLFHLLFNNLRTAVFRTSSDGRFFYVNDFLARKSGFKNSKEFLDAGVNVSDLYLNKKNREEFLYKLKGSTAFEKQLIMVTLPNNKGYYLEVTARSRKNQAGELEYIEGIATDVSDRERYLQKLESSRANLNAILQTTSEAYILIDKNGNIQAWNPRAEAVAGKIWSGQLKAQMPVISLASSKESKELLKNYQRVLQGQRVEFEKTIEVDGKANYFIFSFQPVIMQGGDVDSVVMRISDITKSKTTELNLFNTVDELEDIFENSLTGIMVVDENRTIRKLNSQICDIFGYTRDEILNQSAEMLHMDSESYKAFGTYFYKAINEGMVSNVELPFRHKSGKEIILRFNGKWFSPKSTSDSPMVIWNLQDITERVKNRNIKDTIYKISQTLNKEGKLSDLLEETRQHISKIIKVDNFMIALYDEKRDAFTLPLMADDYDEFTAYDAEGTISRMVIKENRSFFLRSEGIQHLINSRRIEAKGAIAKVWLGVPMRMKSKPIGVIVVQDYQNEHAYSRDDLGMLEFLSEQISMSIVRKNNEEQLKENIETKNKLFSIIAHDLKAPFNSLIGLSSLLEQGTISDEEDLNEVYQNLHETSREGYALLENLLLWTRSQLGRMDHQEGEVKLDLLVDSVFNLLENNASLKGIQLINKVAKGFLIKGDENKLQTILRNLISNSLKYSYPDSNIEVDARFKEHDILISVKDHGIGMSSHMAENLFSPGSDFKRQGTHREKGTGLGLLICREFVEHHKGRIWVESEKNEGSTFYVAIPLAKKQQYKGVEQKKKEKVVAENDKKHILVVEDVNVNYVLLQKILQKMNMKVSHAWNGREAVDFVRQQQPDAILMDINMPLMNGIEATQIIKKEFPSIPVIIQTAYTSNENKEESKAAGADDYLEKPIIKKKLEYCLNKYL